MALMKKDRQIENIIFDLGEVLLTASRRFYLRQQAICELS